MVLTGAGRNRRTETCPDTLSTTILNWTDRGSKLRLCYDMPATNRLSIGAAFKQYSLPEIYTV